MQVAAQHARAGFTAADGGKYAFVLSGNGLTTYAAPSDLTFALDNGGRNAEGEIVATACDSSPCTASSTDLHGIVVDRSGAASVDLPGARYTVFFGTNARHDVVGLYQDAAGKTHGLLWRMP